MDISLETRKVDAVNLEAVIEEIEIDHTLFIRGLGISGYMPTSCNIWPMPIENQVERLVAKWSDPKSDGTGCIFYFKYKDAQY